MKNLVKQAKSACLQN